MDNTTIVLIITMIGAVSGTLIPYIIKVWKDPALEFDPNYFYALVMGIVIQAVALVPGDVPVLSIQIMVNAFAAGAGIQMLLNKAVPKGA